jgi:hypothetical protein
MYAWLWRKLPFGLYGKLAGSVLLVTLVGVLLWFFVFPWMEPAVMPSDDVQVGDPGTSDTGGPDGGVAPTPSFDPEDHEIPYETTEPTTPNTPSPSKRR